MTTSIEENKALVRSFFAAIESGDLTMNADGKAVEHWDTLQAVPAPLTAANSNGMF